MGWHSQCVCGIGNQKVMSVGSLAFTSEVPNIETGVLAMESQELPALTG